ncbi:hypothetical protein FIBSPDRAFT_966509 [Athelia psychrophila]|uniref:Uncharacterized protein n=1 Tax=Athelia psychrophila TaxID=1759441 RepID=A0A167WR91_9AGAM|nr:hypothetical protein FIBSPDRAFT_966509 [Fibularhizoctonia sp. CBS 109695]
MDPTPEREEAGNKATVIFNAHQTSGGLVNNVHGNLTMGDYQNHNHIDYVQHANIYISNIVTVDERLKDPREMDPAGPPLNEPTTNTETGTMRLAGAAISGFLLPPIHSMPHFFTQQPNRSTLSTQTEQWTRLILAYARHRKLFMFHAEDAVATTGEWGAVLLNERINRRILPAHLGHSNSYRSSTYGSFGVNRRSTS